MLLGGIRDFRNFRGGGHFCAKIGTNPDPEKNKTEIFEDFENPLMTFFVFFLTTCSRRIGSLVSISGELFRGMCYSSECVLSWCSLHVPVCSREFGLGYLGGERRFFGSVEGI